MVREPARSAGDPGSNPGPGENFSLKLVIGNKLSSIIRPGMTFSLKLWILN